MVGLADLKIYTDNLKTCQMTVNNKYCYFRLSGLTTYEFLDILNYKSWVYKTYQKNVTVRYVNMIKKLEMGNAILRTSIGFGPLLLRFLRSLKFQIRDQDIEAYRARNVVFPDLKINLYDFQERMIQNWVNAGSIGVLKSPTGSGKCARYDTLILTNKGLIKIEDIVKRISDSGRDGKDVAQSSLYDSFGNECVDDENIKGINDVISMSSDLNYGIFNISARHDMGISNTIILTTGTGYRIVATPEHRIIIINKDGNLEFKKLDDITVDDYVAIACNTNLFNDKLKLNYWFRPSKYESNARFMKNIEYMNEDIARLLGYIISEGTDFGNRDGNITNYDKEVQYDIIKICDNIGLSPKYVYREGRNQENSIGMDIYSKSFLEFLHYLGYRHGSKNKEIPWSILQADKKSQVAFIRSLFDGDGTVYHKDIEDRKYGQKYAEYAGYASSSYELCRQLQIMLLNMGIVSSLKTKKGVVLEYRGEFRQYDESYLLHITGGDLIKFAETISFGLTRKKEILDKCVETLKNRERWTDIIYPHIDKKLNILYERLKILGQKGGITKTWEEDFDFNGKIIKLIRRRKMSHFQYLEDCQFRREMSAYVKGDVYPSKLTLDKILNILNPNSYIEKLPESGEYQIYKYLMQLSNRFMFDKIEDIKKGKDRVYDVTIEGVHSYIGNGMINHNTVVGCAGIKQVGRKALILVHTSDLLINVWNDSLIKTFGPGIMSQVGIIGGGLTDSDRMAMKIGVRTGDFEENVKKDIVIATFQTLNNKIDILSQYKFGLMIVDECIPIDSDIWTKDGVVRYEDLGYGQEYKNDTFQVWSRDNEDNIVNNGYKKIKTRMKHMYRTIVETGDELVCSLDHKVLSRRNDGSEEFIEIEKANNIARSLIKPYDMRKECILARIFGYALGDGYISSGGGGFIGDKENLERISYDIKKLNSFLGTGDSLTITETYSDSVVHNVLYGEKHITGICYKMGMGYKLKDKLIELGFPIGKKANLLYDIPNRIMNGTLDIKREFLAAYLGAEATNSSFRGNEKNKLKKSFYVPRFSISKRSDLVGEGLKLIEQFKKLFADFGVDISNVSVTDSNIRKDGTVSKELRVTIGNQVDNLRRYFEIGYRYCKEKEINGELIRLYLKYISECDNERKEIQKKVLDLYDRNIKHRERIVAIINNSRTSSQKNIMSSWGVEEEDNKIINKKYLVRATDGIVSDILYPHKRNNKEVIAKTAKIKAGMFSFNDWLDKVVGDFIFLDILKHEYRGYEQGYTLTVDKDHNYLVNGFVKENCHHVPAAMFRKVNAAIRAPYKMGLSATVRRLDGLEKDVYGSLGDIQTSVSIRELINKGILAEPRFQSPVIMDHGAIDAIESCGHAGLVFSRFVKKTSASSTMKKDYIINICKNVAARDRKFLLFTDYVRAEDVYVRDMYAEALLKEGIRVAIIDQGMSTEERSAVFGFLEIGEISGIVFGRLGSEGVNIPSVDVVIMANAIKSPITFTQRVGRVMRKVPGKDFCDVYEILLDVPTEYRWSEYNFAEYKMEGFQKLVYKVE